MFALSVLQKVALPKPDSFRRYENKKKKTKLEKFRRAGGSYFVFVPKDCYIDH